jgi:hypothetical protein
MNVEEGTWNEENVHAFFDPFTAAQILQTPIARRVGVDFVTWPFTRHGSYSVRSSYNLARSAKFIHSRSKSGFGISSTWMDREKEWKEVWKIKAPGKMLIHLWRFAHDCLPSGAQLCKRKIPASGLCIFCDRPEGIEHAMLTCQFARMVWQEVKQHYPIKLERKGFRSPMQWLFDFLARSSELQASVLAVGFCTSREKLIAGRLIAGASECNSPVVILPLAHSIVFTGDNGFSPAHSAIICQRYGMRGPPAQVRHIRIFIPGAYSTYAPGIGDLPPANICSVRRG